MKNEEIPKKKRVRRKKIKPLIKKCPKCLTVKDVSLFYKKESKCIVCIKILRKEIKKEIKKEMSANDLMKLRELRKEYHIKNRERKKEYDRIKNITKKDQINLRKRNKYKSDIKYRLSLLLRSRIRDAMKGLIRPGSAVKDMGCTVQELKDYLESKFKEGMSWENHTVYGWHIDHKKPLAMFDLTNRESFLEACHYTNLQPSWWIDNVRKGSRYVD